MQMHCTYYVYIVMKGRELLKNASIINTTSIFSAIGERAHDLL